MGSFEKYEPIEPNYYNYEMNFLESDIDYYLSTNNSYNINICAYQIVNESLYPFLKYLLVKNSTSGVLSLPNMPIFNVANTNTLLGYSEIYLLNIFLLQNSEFSLDKLEYKGCYIYENQVYVFYDLTHCNLQISDIYIENKIWFSLIDEIINLRHVCNQIIDNETSLFFANNETFCFLKDKNKNNYDLPIVAYVGKNEKMLNFTYVFGVSSKDKNSILGPYYYFTNYQNSIKQGGWSENGESEFKHGVLLTDTSNGRYIKGGVVRFALFLEKTKVLHNFQNDDIDISSIKYEKLNDPTCDSNYERLTMRITDYDGKWAEHYDSVYLGKVELDNGNFIKETPIIVIKNYNQQYPLSYHYINKKYLGDKFDENENYLIA